MQELLRDRANLLITVIGVGGCGCNTINMLSENNFHTSVNLVAVNTDLAVLNHALVDTKILIGESLTNGYGAGADPAIGLKAAEESDEILRSVIDGSDIVIITAGFGGGTGTGASPYIANICRELAINCIAIVTLPFESESHMRMSYALEGIERIKTPTHAFITLSNDLLLKGLGESVGLFSAFKHSNDVLNNLLTALVQMVTQTGFINVDINDFARVLSYEGESILGVGTAESEENAFTALDNAINNPIVDNVNIASAKGVILQICCRNEPTIETYNGLLNKIQQQVKCKSTLIIAGVTLDTTLANEIELLVIASGIEPVSEQTPKVEPTIPVGSKQVLDYISDELTFITEDEEYTDIPSIIRNMKDTKLKE
ncbi:MAG: cell division protein FtsZ [Cognaticolwellia sp.]